MNLIFCSDNCKFQKDGYCTLKNSETYVETINSTNNCIYFVSKENKNIKN